MPHFILEKPYISEKATDLQNQGKYVFRVSRKANKISVKKAIEEMYGVKVKKVNIIHLPPKRRRLGRFEGWKDGLKKGFKKAIVTLEKGEKIEY
mgnify:CR=1 FL=1